MALGFGPVGFVNALAGRSRTRLRFLVVACVHVQYAGYKKVCTILQQQYAYANAGDSMTEKRTVSFRVTEETHKAAVQFRNEHGMSDSDAYRELVRRGLAYEETEKRFNEVNERLEAVEEKLEAEQQGLLSRLF